MVEISTSILSVKNEDAIGTFYNLEVAKTDYFHIDVMDGLFVEQDTTKMMQEYCNHIKQISNLPLDVHLMVNDVKKYIDIFIPYNPNIITFHIEACKDKEEVFSIIKYLKENNIKVGIAIKPKTEVDDIFEFIPFIHMALIMTVEPGYGGQKLIPETITKVKELKKYIIDKDIDMDIEVDGGINLENKEELIRSGANIMVIGNAIIKTQNYIDTIKKFKNK